MPSMVISRNHAYGHRHLGLRTETGILASPTPRPTPTSVVPVSAYPSGVLTADQVASYARRAGFEAGYIDDMVRFAARESTFNPTAVHGGGPAYAGGPACGLWQLYPCPGPSSLDPMVNAWQAREKCLADVAAGYSCLRPWGG